MVVHAPWRTPWSRTLPETLQEPVRVQIFTQQCAVIADPALMKRVLNTNIKNYAKDLDFSYKPFMARPPQRDPPPLVR